MKNGPSAAEELLRTVGRYVDYEESRLVKLTKKAGTLILRLRDNEGSVRSLECSMMALYKHQTEYDFE